MLVTNWDIATREEVMAFWTEWMRSDDVSFVHRVKASELLARAYGIFREAVEPERVQIESPWSLFKVRMSDEEREDFYRLREELLERQAQTEAEQAESEKGDT